MSEVSGADGRLTVGLVLAEAVGGIGRHVGWLARGLASRGIDVTVCGPQPTLAGLGGLGPIRTLAAPIGRFSPVGLTRSRAALLRAAGSVDVFHAHGLRAGAAVATFVPAAPRAVTWHNAWLGGAPGRFAHRRLAGYVARHSDMTLAASPDLAEAARQAGAKQIRSTFIAAPPLGPPARARSEVRTSLGAATRPLVLAIGRLQAQKRFDVLVAAAAGWADDPAGPMVAIAGDGPDRASLAAQIATTGAPVLLLGARDDIPDLLAAADLVALPSRWEARALVAQEALRSGVPLVTTAVGGLPDLVGPAAVTVAEGDPTGLRAAIEQVLGNGELRDRLIAAGRARAQTWPSPDRMIDELIEIYLDLKRTLRPGL